MTSERGVVEHTDPAHGRLHVRFDDGRRQVLDRAETALDRLDHGYALTVHRAQGATVDVAHRYEDGGGRELAYVSMSRARQHSTIHVVADNLPQAADDLRRDWSAERRPRWAIDTGTPTTDPLAAEHDRHAPAELSWALRSARLEAERDALRALLPPDSTPELLRAESRVVDLRQRLEDLEHGTGRYQHGEIGAAAKALRDAAQRTTLAERALADPDLGWRMRRHWRHDLADATRAEDKDRTRLEQLTGPERAKLTAALQDAEADALPLRHQADETRSWKRSHPGVATRLQHLDRELAQGPVPPQQAVPEHSRSVPSVANDGIGIEL